MDVSSRVDKIAVSRDRVSPESSPGDVARPSLRRNASSRLAVEVFCLVLSLVSAVIVARLLGPAGKGLYSTLWLLASLFSSLFMIGLGETAIVMVRQRGLSKDHVITTSFAASIALGLLGGLACIAVAAIVVGTSPPSSWLTILAAGLTVAIGIPAVTVSVLQLIDEHVIRASLVVGASVALSTVVLVVALVAFDGDVTMALAAGASGSALTIAAGLHKLRNHLRPVSLGRVAAYLRSAARLGAAFQISALLIQATNRVDLLLVYRIRSPAEAGTYSIALTIGALVILMPWAISYASFPRIARLEPEAANALISRIVRTSLVVVTAAAMAIGALVPFAIPIVFGSDFSSAVGPSLILLLAGIFGGCQLVLCRGIAAKGETRPLVVSYLTNLLVMVGLDFLLIPPAGPMGAAAAYVSSTIVGLSVALVYYRRGDGSIRELLPRTADLAGLWTAIPGRARSRSPRST